MIPTVPGVPNLQPPQPSEIAEDEAPVESIATSESPSSEESAEALGHVIEDDDRMVAPAPSPEVFAPKALSPRPVHGSILKTLAFRRTSIPVLLTLGLVLLIVGSLKFLRDPESPFAALSLWLVLTVMVMGLILIGLGVFNMILVKQQLEAKAA